MRRKTKRGISKHLPRKASEISEKLFKKTKTIYLNTVRLDRISFSVLQNSRREIKRIENVSYDININDEWIGIVRYDDHDGKGILHRHSRLSIERRDEVVESLYWLTGDKNHHLTQICDEIREGYQNLKDKFLKNSGLD